MGIGVASFPRPAEYIHSTQKRLVKNESIYPEPTKPDQGQGLNSVRPSPQRLQQWYFVQVPQDFLVEW
jgi:hypothetical protein